MAEKVYFEFQGVIEDKGITYFLIELDKYDFEGKESENLHCEPKSLSIYRI